MTFNMSEQDVLRIRANMAKRNLTLRDIDKVPCEVGLMIEEGFPHIGHLDYAAPEVDPSTGTLLVRCIFENKDRSLIPGYFARVRVPLLGQTGEALLVPDAAIGTSQLGRYLLVVNKDNSVEQRVVEVGQLFGNLRQITKGLDGGRPRGDQRHPACHSGTQGRPSGSQDRPAAGGQRSSRDRGRAQGMISKFFIERPVLANVLAIVFVLIGGVALYKLPIAQYPNVVPPTISVTTSYPGASATTVMNTVALPIEEQVNGVEHMIYMQSTSASDGTYSLIVTFEIGTDLNFAQVLVQNRVAIALAQLPNSVQAQGVNVQQKSTAILQIASLTSKDGRYDSLYLSNYATINLVSELARLPGVGNVNVFGVGQYSMRIWLDPQKLYSVGLTAQDVIDVVKQQSQDVAPGQIGSPPAPDGQNFQYTINVLGRFTDVEPVREHHRQDRQRQWRPDHADQGCRAGGAGQPDLFPGLHPEWTVGRRHRDLSIPRCQCPRCRQKGEGQARRALQGLSARDDLHHPLRHHALRLCLDLGGLQDPDRGRCAGADRDPGLPAGLEGDAGAGDHGAGDHHRRLRGHGRHGIHRQSLDPLRHRARHRHRGGRCHRGGGGGRPPYRGGVVRP